MGYYGIRHCTDPKIARKLHDKILLSLENAAKKPPRGWHSYNEAPTECDHDRSYFWIFDGTRVRKAFYSCSIWWIDGNNQPHIKVNLYSDPGFLFWKPIEKPPDPQGEFLDDWQDAERTWIEVERVYETRFDCKPMPGGARLVA